MIIELRDAVKISVSFCDYFTPSIKVVSKVLSNVRTNVISLRVFSNITFGSFEGHRRKFGAQTIAKLFTSILVTLITSALQKILRKHEVNNSLHCDFCCDLKCNFFLLIDANKWS